MGRAGAIGLTGRGAAAPGVKVTRAATGVALPAAMAAGTATGDGDAAGGAGGAGGAIGRSGPTGRGGTTCGLAAAGVAIAGIDAAGGAGGAAAGADTGWTATDSSATSPTYTGRREI